ncbi:MAG: hypothetical protein ACP5UV_02050 [Thermoplasmata archaeon]
MADIQTIMKAQAELAYTEERLRQIHDNREKDGYDPHEYEVLTKKRAQLLAVLNRRS